MSTLKIGKFGVDLLRTDHEGRLLHDDVVITVTGGDQLRCCANDLDDLLIILRLARERALSA